MKAEAKWHLHSFLLQMWWTQTRYLENPEDTRSSLPLRRYFSFLSCVCAVFVMPRVLDTDLLTLLCVTSSMRVRPCWRSRGSLAVGIFLFLQEWWVWVRRSVKAVFAFPVDVTIDEWPFYLLPLDDDIISLELPEFFQDNFLVSRGQLLVLIIWSLII